MHRACDALNNCGQTLAHNGLFPDVTGSVYRQKHPSAPDLFAAVEMPQQRQCGCCIDMPQTAASTAGASQRRLRRRCKTLADLLSGAFQAVYCAKFVRAANTSPKLRV